MLAFSIDYYGIFFGATQSVELFCTYHLHVIFSIPCVIIPIEAFSKKRMAVLNNRHSTLHILFTTVKCNQTCIFQIYPFLAFSIFISLLFLLFLKNHYLQSRYNYCHLVMLLYFHKYLLFLLKF